nr:hypothetical protein HmN_000988200 [Hymenolepis microstoma]
MMSLTSMDEDPKTSTVRPFLEVLSSLNSMKTLLARQLRMRLVVMAETPSKGSYALALDASSKRPIELSALEERQLWVLWIATKSATLFA